MLEWRNTAERYGVIARVLHWAIGALLLVEIAIGIVAFELLERSAQRSALIGVHKALGVTLLALVLVRIVWRALDRPPALPATMCEAERRGARAGHALLYLLMLAVPVLGWISSDLGGRAIDVFGMFSIPSVLGEHEELHEAFETGHQVAAWSLLGMIALHVAGALYNHLFRTDGVLRRML
jgi:cytochrome b561